MITLNVVLADIDGSLLGFPFYFGKNTVLLIKLGL